MLFDFCLDAGLWKVSVVTGVHKPQDSDDSREQDTAAGENGEKEIDATDGAPNTHEKQADVDERRDNGDDLQAEQHLPQNDSSKENTDTVKSRNENEEQEAPSEDPLPPTCRLVMVLYGDQGKTQPLFLGDNESISKTRFQPGVADMFIVS